MLRLRLELPELMDRLRLRLLASLARCRPLELRLEADEYDEEEELLERLSELSEKDEELM